MASPPHPLWFLVTGASLSLVTVVGNGLVVYLTITRKRLHNATNWIVLSLAIADFTVGAGFLPAGTLLKADHPLVQYNVMSFLAAASALNLSLLTVDRYVFITRPLRYSTLLYSTLLYSTLLYSTLLYSTLLYSTLLYSTLLYSTLLYSTLLYSTLLYSTLLYSTLLYSTLLYSTDHQEAVLLIVTLWLASFVPHLLLYLTSAENDTANPPRAFEFFDIAVFEISPIIALPSLAGRIFVIVRRQERRMKTQMRQVRFNRQAEPGSELSSHIGELELR